ncbi:hypothetical protein WMF30_24245 [Sorangium sp. So ce134]
MRRLTCLSLAVTALLQGAACSEDAAPGDPTGGAGAAGATSTTTSGGGSSTGGGEGGQGGGTGTGGGGGAGTGGTGGAGAGGAGGAGTGGATYGYCAKGCMIRDDCCAQDQRNCPSDSYPTNYTCDNNICVAPQCASDEDCTNGGLDPTKRCVPSGGLNGCVTPCTLDTDCPGTSKCIGTDDTGSKFCRIESEPFVCTRTEECAGFGECVNGACVCDDNDDCTDPSADACVLR